MKTGQILQCVSPSVATRPFRLALSHPAGVPRLTALCHSASGSLIQAINGGSQQQNSRIYIPLGFRGKKEYNCYYLYTSITSIFDENEGKNKADRGWEYGRRYEMVCA